MPLVIIATPNAATANSYVTEAEQIAYMATRSNASAWTTFSGSVCTEPEKQAMIEATRELDSYRWLGTRATDTQFLQWPRWWVLNPDMPWVGLVYYRSDEVPQRIKTAVAELAFQFLNMGAVDLASLDTTLNVKEKQVDVIRTVYVDPWRRPKGLGRFPLVARLVGPLLDRTATGATMRVVRG